MSWTRLLELMLQLMVGTVVHDFLGFTITMVKTIVFAIIFIIRLHHYNGEDYCFCLYY